MVDVFLRFGVVGLRERMLPQSPRAHLRATTLDRAVGVPAAGEHRLPGGAHAGRRFAASG